MDKFSTQFGARLKQARIDMCLSRKELADLVYVSEGSITGWENGKRLPDLPMTCSLAGWLKVSLDWLVMGRGGKK